MTVLADQPLKATLENGLGVVIVRNALAPVVTVQMNYRVGGDESPPEFPGTAHALEHMMFRGSPGLSADQLAAISSALGGRCNAETQQTVTRYFCTVPTDGLTTILRVEAARMRGILATESLWREERGALEQEVDGDLSDPEYLLFSRLLDKIFAGTPYAQDPLGTRPSFSRTSGAMLKKFHHEWYAPNNALLVITGDVEPTGTLADVREIFGTIPAHPLPKRPPVDLKPLKGATITLTSDLSQKVAVVAYRLPGYDSPDFAAGEVLTDVLDSQRGDLYALISQGKAIDVRFDSYALPKGALGYAAVQFPADHDADAMVSAMKRIIAGYARDGVPADLVEAAKRRAATDREFSRNSIEGLASDWSQAVAVEGRSSPDDDLEAIARVTADDVNRVARTWLRNETSVTALLLPGASGKPVPLAKKDPGSRKEALIPRRTKPVSLPSWARAAADFPALPTIRQPAVSTLTNGMRILVYPVNAGKSVEVYGRVATEPDLQVPEGKEGIDDLLNSLFSYGTKSLDRVQFQKALDDIAADVTAGSDFSLRVPSGALDRGLALLADNLLHPAFPAEAFRVTRGETASALTGEQKSPAWSAKRTLAESVNPLRYATPASVTALSPDDLEAYYRKVFRPDMTTLVFVGDIETDRAKALAEKYFSAWTADGAKPDTELPPLPRNRVTSHFVPDESRVQDEVMLMETLSVSRNDPAYYPLQVGIHILSGDYYSSRLYKSLREKTGLVYSIEAGIEFRKKRSLFGVTFGCEPAMRDKALGRLREELLDMQTRPVSPEELQRAKAFLVRQVALAYSSTEEIGKSLLDLSSDGLPLDTPVQAARGYLGVTRDDILHAFRSVIRPDGFAQVVWGPPRRHQ
ncbi:MAG TPA: pitrilysin family protein [Desulfuromonadaceae bacterium]